MSNIEIVTIHYKTADLLSRLYSSIRKHLGDVPVRVIDGSMEDPYTREIRTLAQTDENLTVTRIDYNIHHGRGMNYALATTEYKYVLFMDSDSVVLRAGLLEYVMASMKSGAYGCGYVIGVLDSGASDYDGFPYLHPKCMLISAEEYTKYPRFMHHGAPCIQAMKGLYLLGDSCKLINLDKLDDYTKEDGRGTVSRYGYGTAMEFRGESKFNILIRTSGRPNYFRKCYESIAAQEYSNYRIIVSCDDAESERYVSRYNVDTVVRVKRAPKGSVKQAYYISMKAFVAAAPYNAYFDEMYEHVAEGYIIHIDDDDAFNDTYALAELNKLCAAARDLFIVWRVLFPNGRLVPSDEGWGKEPVRSNISGIGFAFHSDYRHLAEWGSHTWGDYRTAKMMSKALKTIHINKPLTKVQRAVANGLGRRDDL